MRLHKFILKHIESILLEWESFARTVKTALPAMDAKRLRDHAEQILTTIAQDMQTYQSERQQIAKSQGYGSFTEEDEPSRTHAMTRFVAGFSMDQMVSEYRALRSSVLRLWLARKRADAEHDVEDMIRFNEAIDQALVASIATFGEAVESTRKTVLGVLGHDLRSPLGAVLMASELLRESENVTGRDRKLVMQISSSVGRANQMVADLLDLARCNLGNGIPVNREDADLGVLCASTVDELRTGFPHAHIIMSAGEALTGRYDSARMAQVFTNLIGNAVRHGDLEHPINVELSRNDDYIVFSVQNRGELIPISAIPRLFDPQVRYSSYAAKEKGSSAGLGLGLFIASEIISAHDGKIEVTSTAELGTVFKVLLPIT
ncbi:two-component sensor histidine kinase [Pseudomonas syringae]|uniref:histidine kinase n=1 Tax=Pseudomonas syringae TaxID=317 RepID=A0AB37ZUZ0_PSESX|nr:HAMP domain-containing sensor histidine kinase [Pseudomonas syringae]MBI6669641.1 sensor histidine kinase [Pseudomonas syringae]MBI6679652.1 sensor histidine kinase [Pseudomonas syringae]MBI6839646.1 sensor histidine kinase [Pseudomonas syringae]NAP22203.1 sensor histidine kinase [Pseudomonas syringae]NAQ17812.1 sensor histidine kinase [Pseudomonas syringae]